VYLCESTYDEHSRQLYKFEREGLKKYSRSNAIYEDEIYFFRRPLNPQRVSQSNNIDLLTLFPDLSLVLRYRQTEYLEVWFVVTQAAWYGGQGWPGKPRFWSILVKDVSST